MRNLRLLSETVTCLELNCRWVADPSLNPCVPTYIHRATVMSGLVTFLMKREFSPWGSEVILLSCFQIGT